MDLPLGSEREREAHMPDENLTIIPCKMLFLLNTYKILNIFVLILNTYKYETLSY